MKATSATDRSADGDGPDSAGARTATVPAASDKGVAAGASKVLAVGVEAFDVGGQGRVDQAEEVGREQPSRFEGFKPQRAMFEGLGTRIAMPNRIVAHKPPLSLFAAPPALEKWHAVLLY